MAHKGKLKNLGMQPVWKKVVGRVGYVICRAQCKMEMQYNLVKKAGKGGHHIKIASFFLQKYFFTYKRQRG